MASTAAGGKVWPMAVTVSRMPAKSRPLLRVTKTPAATPAIAMGIVAASTMPMCQSVSVRKLARV